MPPPKRNAQVSTQELESLIAAVKQQAANWKERLRRHKTVPHQENLEFKAASDCTGYGSDLIALTLLGCQPRAKLIMTSDPDRNKYRLMHAVAKACGWSTQELPNHIKNMMDRDNAQAPVADLYVAGYPCPSYSRLGKKKGCKDRRGCLTLYGLQFIVATRPRTIVLEQVAAILDKTHRKLWAFLQKILETLEYEFKFAKLNTKDFGVPQSRPRMYLIAVAKEVLASPLTLPSPRSDQVDLHHFLEKEKVGQEVLDLPRYQELLGNRMWTKGYVLDVGSSAKFQNVSVNVSPCLTKTRLKQGAYYIPKLKRRLLCSEAGRLQGLPAAVIQAMEAVATTKSLPARTVDEAIGDAMSINVLTLVLRHALDASGLTKLGGDRDYWLRAPSGEAAANLSDRLFDKATTKKRAAGR